MGWRRLVVSDVKQTTLNILKHASRGLVRIQEKWDELA